jgi:branched-chain amino acid transport system permease protein
MSAIGGRSIVALVCLGLLALVPPAAALADAPFYVQLFARVMIFAIAALSLDFILGYGGLVSFGHAAYLGIGGYAVGILSFHGIGNGFVHFAAALGAAAVAAALIGFVSLRTAGVYFIMITLAFSQMVYFLGISLHQYGGDDGLNIARHSDFAGLFDLAEPVVLYYFVLAFLALFLFVGHRVVRSRFGVVLQGVRSNERRMIALGFPTFRYKLAAFVIAGAVCGLAGALFANLTLFISPSIMHWTRSGEIMMMVILGGIGTLFGPVLGAATYLLLEGVLSRWTEHWQAVLGPVLILVVLFSKSGLVGLVASIFPSSPGSTQGALEVAADGRVKLGHDETSVGPSTRDG